MEASVYVRHSLGVYLSIAAMQRLLQLPVIRQSTRITMLRLAIACSSAAVVQVLLECGVAVNTVCPVNLNLGLSFMQRFCGQEY